MVQLESNVEELLFRLRNYDIDVNVVDEKLVINVPEGFDEKDLIEEVREKKGELISYITERKRVKVNKNPVTKAVARDYYKLTSPQKRLYFSHELSKNSTAYNLTQPFIIRGSEDKAKLVNCFKELISRHEALRTRFDVVDHQLVQHIMQDTPFDITYIDGKNQSRDAIIRDFVKPFDLKQAPLMRVALIELGVDENMLLIDTHHIISDGTSQQILLKDFASLYNGEKLQPLELNYSDYAEWYHGEPTQKIIQEQKEFWTREFEGMLATLELPADFPRPAEKKFTGDTYKFSLSRERSAAIQGIAEQSGVSMFTVLLSFYSIWLSKLCGQEDIIIGTPTAGRKDADLQKMFGMFVNTLALRMHPESGITFREYLSKVNLRTLNCFDNQDFPYEDLVDALQINRDLSHNPLFDVVFMFQNIFREKATLEGLNIEGYNPLLKTSKFDLSLVANVIDARVNFIFEYSTELFRESTIAQFARYFTNAIHSILDNEDIVIGDISVINESDRKRLLAMNNNTDVKYPQHQTIIDVFEQRAAEMPGNEAIIEKGQAITYGELNERANKFAQYLREKGVGKDVLVGVLMEKSTDLIVAMLAILKAGGAYVPVDVTYPKARLEYILDDSKVEYLVTDSKAPEVTAACSIIPFEDLQLDQYSGDNLSHINTPGDLCYVIYTSGTTGNPKGVLIEHRNVIRLLFNEAFQFEFGQHDVWTMFHSHCFDFSVWEMYGALLYGGKMVIVSKLEAMNPAGFLDILREQKVTVLNQTPTAFYNLIHEDLKDGKGIPSLRYVVFGGEMLSPSKLKVWQAANPDVKLINMFGTTETTVHATYKEIGVYEIENNISNIGKPIPTLSVYVFDKAMNVLPEGVTGEMFIGGAGVGRGYLRREALTAERFIQNPYRRGEVLYRTGDLARILTGGEIEYLGRQDSQVKIRGFRIELGEIEHHLLEHELIDNAVVIVRKDEEQKYLCAYLVSRQELSVSEIRMYLNDKLPAYMVPAYFVQVETMPLTSNSKVDISKLPEPVITADSAFVAPANEKEKVMAEVWAQILGMKEVGTRDNYFSLGGDSLKAIGLIYEMNSRLNMKLSIADLYTNQTIEKLAALSAEQDDAKDENLQYAEEELKRFAAEYIERNGSNDNYEDILPMNGVEKGMVFHSLKEKAKDGNIHNVIYHEQNIYSIPYEGFSFDMFKKALNLLVEKHSELRKVFDLDSFAHIILKKIEPVVDFADLSGLEKEEQEAWIHERMHEEKLRATDLSLSVIWRMCIIKISDDYHYLLFDMHHSLFDGWSLSSFVTELNNTYVQLKSNADFVPKKLLSNYRDQVIGEIANAKNPASAEYWKNELDGYTRMRFLPTGLKHQFITKRITLERRLRKDLESLAENCETSFKHLCFAAYVQTMRMLSWSDDIVVGLVANNRPVVPDGEQLLGCFLNTIPVRVQLPVRMTWKDYILYIEDKVRVLKNHEQVPLYDVLRIINDRTNAGNAVFDTAFNYIDFRVFKDIVDDDYNAENPAPDFKFENYININTLLGISVHAHDNGFQLVVTYSTSIVDEDLSERIIQYYKNILSQFVNNLYGTINNQSIMPADESERLLNQFNGTGVLVANHTVAEPAAVKAAINANRTVIDLFEEQVAKTPDSIAVEFEHEQITYKELDERSNQLARCLQNMGVKAETLVPIFVERSADMMTGILGILKAGGAYVPIDAEYPKDRIDYMLADCKASLILSTSACMQSVSIGEEYKVILLDEDKELIYTGSKASIGRIAGSDNLAYVIYTSGSTGMPKGVMIEHKGLYASTIARSNYYGNVSSCLLISSFAFDSSIAIIFNALHTGARLVLCKNASLKDREEVETLLQKVELILCVPSYYDFLVAEGIVGKSSLKRVILAGEKINRQTVLNHFNEAPDVALYNEYGPTECSVWSSVAQLSPADEIISIGKPIDNWEIYIVNNHADLAAQGTIGEICIGGMGLARGYMNREDLTGEKFVANPFRSGELMYMTGDLGRWLPDGNIEFMGRKDDQVKIRGFRIELGEIEKALSGLTGITACSVLVNEDHTGNKRLVGYVVLEKETTLDKEALEADLKKIVPEYMVPRLWVQLEAMPLTSNGKTDKKALPSPEMSGLSRKKYVAPRTKEELQLAEIWKELLGLPQIGIHDDFFDLGGHSILATRLVSMIRRIMNVEFTIKDVFEFPSIEAMVIFMNYKNSDADKEYKTIVKI